jgi:hypothetical protein
MTMNSITVFRINRALKKEVGADVKFRAGSLRFKEDNPPQEKIGAAINVVNRFTRWLPDYDRMKIADEL